MSYQEAREMQSTDYYEELQTIEELAGGYEESGAINRLAMLSLNNPPAAASNLCAACGSSAKRRSPSSFQGPATKKQLIFLPPPSATTAARSPPPATTQCASPPRDSTPPTGLRRTVSDVVNFSGTATPPPAQILKSQSQSPGNPKIEGSATTFSPVTGSTSLPPRPPPLWRSTSDPVQLLTSTPPRAATAARKPSESPNSGELSAESKRFHRMRDGMIEMLQQLDQVMQEEKDQEEEEEGEKTEEVDCDGEEAETETEEAVSVEKSGDSLIVHFKCPCKKTFQILLSGNNCYYKLM